MPQSRELTNKKNEHKDRQQRGPIGTGVGGPKKGGAGAHNWGTLTAPAREDEAIPVDRNDPNYVSSLDH
ncbi:hypothetical protein KXD40_003556 [Peronospora effusa]|uniref:Hyaluronan/mRNA-binding protein domain-containing protein n=2 Tax=Peronospora TaxID=70742 RepID=A0A3M6V958_9STRA|nr:hypothetical protein DD238_007436 [Peronospora effusa]CAH0490137.1 unnamed protein product [Peronospora farinosa]RQM12808.1 hypothetical protein DD237_007701 [Peronospora effusa]UIZ22946.1 hypothetical protein KXD40_003556 [Peronospora effusa]CAI5725263.1 unnamed protein product [Peronospora effusa]